jgi:DNA excision repair protein ERCC-4
MEIICDTREQKPLWTKNIIREKLEVGDYSIKGYKDKFAIERKSLSDLFGTLGKGHKRFKKELERAKTYEYFAIVIDGSYSSCLNKDFEGSYHSKMRGYVITAILFTLHMKYGINIFFTNGRTESKRIIKELMNSYIKIKK